MCLVSQVLNALTTKIRDISEKEKKAKSKLFLGFSRLLVGKRSLYFAFAAIVANY